MDNVTNVPVPEAVEERQESFYRCDEITISVVSKFSVLLGDRLPEVGDIIKHWESPTVGTAENTGLEILPDNTQSLKIKKIKSINPMTTGGLYVEGVWVTAECELILGV